MTRIPIPNCPQPETPIRDRAWTDEQSLARLRECLSKAVKAVNGPLLTDKSNEQAGWAAVSFLQSHGAQLISILDTEGDGGAVGGEVDRVEAHKSVAAIDRWLRNNMDDEEYAEYSAELDRVFSYNPHPARSGVVSDEDVLQVCVDYYGEPAWKFMSHKFGCLQNMRAALEHYERTRK